MNVCCTECFTDPFLQEYIKGMATRGACSYCGSQGVYVSPVGDLGRHVRTTLEQHFQPVEFDMISDFGGLSHTIHPCCVLAVLRDRYQLFSEPYLRRCREQIGETFLFSINPNSEGYELVQDLLVGAPVSVGSNGLFRDGWRSKIELKRFDLHQRAWSEFKHRVRHFSRYFDSDDQDAARGAIIEPVITFVEKRLSGKLSKGARVWRARVMSNLARFPTPRIAWGVTDPGLIQKLSDEPSETRKRIEVELGPAPLNVAGNNRMSPAGISYMYLAANPDTALAEVRPQVGDQVWLAEFEVARQLRIVDLSNEARFQERPLFSPDFSPAENSFSFFLKSFIQEISRPIDPRVSVLEYVSTQVLCEAIRFREFDGICFRSSVTPTLESDGGLNYVLFCGPRLESDTNDDAYSMSNFPVFTDWVSLRGCQVRKVKGVSYLSSEPTYFENRSF